MTTLGNLISATKVLDVSSFNLPIDPIDALVASLVPFDQRLALGIPSITAAVQAWTDQDDDAHEDCDSLVACRTPLHPGPCKGWKGLLHDVSPGTYHQIEAERVRKANVRRVARIDDLRKQGKPIPRRLLTEIKPKPAPNHPAAQHNAHNVAAVPLGQVGQKADLAGGQAHHAGQAVSKAAGITPNQAPALPLGPKAKKPSVAGRGPAFVITQPKVTDQYKLDKAAKITPAEWDALSPADKLAIRTELTAIKGRGFGPQQTKADALLAKLPAANTLRSGTPGTITTPAGNVHQVINPTPGKVTLGQAVKAVPHAGPTPQAPGAPNNTPKAFAPHVQFARALAGRAQGTRPTSKNHVDTYGKLTKDEFDSLDSATQRTIRDDLANAKAKFLDPKKKQEAADLLDRFGSRHTPPAPSGTPAGGPKISAAQLKSLRTIHALGGKVDGSKATPGIDRSGLIGMSKTNPPLLKVDIPTGRVELTDAGRDLIKGAPNAPHPKGYSDPQAEAVKAATSGLTSNDDVIKSVARLTPAQVGKLDDVDRKAVLSRLAFVAVHSNATDEQKVKAAAYGRIIVGGSHVPDKTKFDHIPSIGELHAEEQKGGHADVADALKAATTPTGLTPGTQRVDRVAALSKLTKAQFDAMPPDKQRQITDALHDLHVTTSPNGHSTTRDAAVAALFEKLTGQHPAIHRLAQAEADFKAGKITGKDLHTQVLHARVQADGSVHQPGSSGDLLAKAEQKVAEDNPSLPLHIRASLIYNDYKHAAYDAIAMATMPHNWDDAPRLSTFDMKRIFGPTDADLAAVHPIQAEAVKALQNHVLETGLRGEPGVPGGSPWSVATRNAAVGELLGTGVDAEIPPDRLAHILTLSPKAQSLVRHALTKQISAQTNNHAKTGTWIALRDLEGRTPLNGVTHDAVVAASDTYPGGADFQDKYRRLDPDEYAGLPVYVRYAIDDHLDTFQQRASRSGPTATFSAQDNPLKVMPLALKAHLNDGRTVYPDRRERNAADIANYGTDVVNPLDRTRAYSEVPVSNFKSMDTFDQRKIHSDLDAIAADQNNSLAVRFGAKYTRDLQVNTIPSGMDADQLLAVGVVHPQHPSSDPAVMRALTLMDKQSFDGLDPVYREAIDERIKGLPGSDQQALNAKFHPAVSQAANPTGLTPTSAQTGVPPHVQAALDTIYGTHASGKSHTMAHQLTTYGALRGHDFQQLNAQEQGHLLGDLSFIATTAKGPSADKAKKLIDRFTPAGTPSGHIPTGAIIPPANAVPGQVRYATPLKGLEKAKDSGKSGDKWINLPGGGRVWGEHGAAGLMLQHVDSATGEKRYLMVQRGPAISDPGKWTFPGGAIDSKETPHQGAARETIEELGLKDDVLKDALVHGDHTFTVPGHPWKYTTVAAQVPSMIKPDLSSPHARAETSDAKWMTIDEIKALDKAGKLHGPIAGGKLETNVISLYPQAASGSTLGQIVRPGPVTKRQGRLNLPSGGRQAPGNFNAWPHAHKQSKGTNLIADKTALDAQRQKIKKDRALYDGKTADGRLAAIGAQQGFDDTPTVADKSEIDRLLATGDYIEAWRGVSGYGGRSSRGLNRSGGKSAADINEEMRSGPAYYGRGIFGNGYYLATQRSVAAQYADHTKGSVARILIPKSALTEKYDKIETEAHSRSTRSSKATNGTYGETSTFYDPGRYAAAKGLDGIEIEHHHRNKTGGGASHVASRGKPAFNWLNRSVLIIQKEPG